MVDSIQALAAARIGIPTENNDHEETDGFLEDNGRYLMSFYAPYLNTWSISLFGKSNFCDIFVT